MTWGFEVGYLRENTWASSPQLISDQELVEYEEAFWVPEPHAACRLTPFSTA